MAVEGVQVARITITRTLTEGDLIDTVTTEDSDGESLAIVESLGMLELAKHTLLTSRDEDEEEDW